MKIGISGFAWTSEFKSSHLGLLPEMKNLGLTAIEIPMFDPGRLLIEDIKLAFQSNGLECTVCAILPAEINPISADRLIRKKSIEHLKRCIEATAAMGAKLMGGPLFAPIGYLPEHRPTGEEWNWAVEAFRSLREDLESAAVTLSIEPVNRSETFFLRTTAEAARLCEAIDDPRIGVTIDTFHANIEEQDICAGIRLLGPALKHIHASENDRGPLGRGHVPFEEIIAALREINYQGYLMIEGFGYSAEERKSPGYLWADPDVSPEAFVAQSYEYLSALLAG